METKVFLIIILSLIGFLLIFTFAVSLISYRMAFYHNRKKKPKPYDAFGNDALDPYRERVADSIESLLNEPYQRIEIRSRDGLCLVGKYYKRDEKAPLHILFHGYKSASEWDFSGGATALLAMGHNVLLVDQRAHSESEGHSIAFGVTERFDVLEWARYADERLSKKTFLWGISMGAATVLMSLELPLPDSVVGAVADCPYSSPMAIIKRVTYGMHLPAGLLSPFVRLGAALFGGFRLGRVSAEDAVKSSRVPVLLIHGEEDGFVPIEMSEKIAASAAASGVDINFQRFPGAAHGLSYLADPERYLELVNEFLEDALISHGEAR